MSNNLFNRDQVTILEEGLKSLSIACDGLTTLNKQLTAEIKELREENERLVKSMELLGSKLWKEKPKQK